MNREVTVYHNFWTGYGCNRSTLIVTYDNLVREDEHTITVVETAFGEDELVKDEVTYDKDIDTFIAKEHTRFSEEIAKITEKHDLTIKLANELKRKDENRLSV